MKFRTLKAEEIELRVGNVLSDGYTLLLYKDARCDMNILDESVGAENWQRDHKEIKGNLYCGVGINMNYLTTKPEYSNPVLEPCYVWKWDCGTESNTEKEKGEASDSFKRACVNWGIGRELYTAPRIKIYCEMGKIGNSYKLPDSEKYRKFKVKEIEYNDKREITKLIIVDNRGFQVYPETSAKIQKEPGANLACCECGKAISEKVANYSKNKYGKELCFDCQQNQGLQEIDV